MYLSKENKEKLILASIVIALSALTLITGKTFANTLILTAYSTKILPYFYLSLAIATIIVTVISGYYQQKNPNRFAFIFKLNFIFILILAIAGIHWSNFAFPFIISIAVLTCTAVTSVIALGYLSDIYDIQEFKQFSKVFQSSYTIGAIISGILVSAISTQFNATKLLLLLLGFELISLFFIERLTKYLPPHKPVNEKYLKFSSTMNNPVFKYFAFLVVTAVISTTLIDYSLKLELVNSITKQHLARVISIIFVISTTGILIFQFFFLDYMLHLLGSKKMVIVLPIGVLIMTFAALIHYNLLMMAILFIVNEILTYTTFLLSRDLYLNILPQSIRKLARMKLKGTVGSVAIMLASGFVLCLNHLNNKNTLSLILIIICCACSLYLAKILIINYRLQLIKSLNLRRFDSDLINMTQVDNNDVQDLLNQALDSPDPEANLFGLQLLLRNRSLHLTQSLTPLLTGDNQKIAKEAAKILAAHTKNKLFIEAAQLTFKNSTNEETKWHLVRYLMEASSDSLIPWVDDLLKSKKAVSLAIACLIYLKQGDLDQQLNAIKLLLNMHHSHEIEKKKWFLYVLKETSLPQKEKYLIEYFAQENPELQTLALQQIGRKPSPHMLDLLVANLGEPNRSPLLSNCLVEIGDIIVERIEDKLKKSTSYPVKISCISTLSLMNGTKPEHSFIGILRGNHDVVMNTAIAKYIAYRGVKLKISDTLLAFLIDAIKTEVDSYFLLLSKLEYYGNLSIRDEITSRLQYIKMRVLFYSAAIIGSLDILNSVSLLTLFHPDKNQQAIALELIDATSKNREISSLLLALFVDTKVHPAKSIQPIDDPWLNQFIHKIESNNMDSIYTFTKLRKVSLFKDLAAETLQVLVECCLMRDMVKGEVIFNEGDVGDGLYIVDSGEVSITRNSIDITTLGESDYFGELALLSDIPRFATVTAITDGALFYIDKQDFDRITDEVPAIMKNINKQVIKYIIKNASIMGTKQK